MLLCKTCVIDMSSLKTTWLDLFQHHRLAACTLLSGRSCTVSSILAPSYGILYCYDIPLYIVTLAILVDRHVGIDDKYRGIVGIAQH